VRVGLLECAAVGDTNHRGFVFEGRHDVATCKPPDGPRFCKGGDTGRWVGGVSVGSLCVHAAVVALVGIEIG
jgi:hypothetical protein